MTEPTSPPLMPPAGWYEDPEQVWTWRYWDGGRWTDHRAPRSAWVPHRDPYSFSSWFEDSRDAVFAVVGRVGLLVAGLWIVTVGLMGSFVFAVFTSSKGRELRDLVRFDSTFGSNNTVELSDAEFDRAGELFGDIIRNSLPWMAAIVIIAVVAGIWAMVLAARVAARVEPGTVMQVSRTDDAADSLRRIPAVFASGIVLVAILVAAPAMVFVPLLVVLAAGGGGASIAVAAVFGGLAAVVLGAWLYGRLALSVVVAALGGHGIGVRRSWELTDGHYWSVVGRLLVASLLASVASAPLSFFNSFTLAFGFAAWVAFVLFLQAVSNVITTVLTIPAQVVIVEHLTEQFDLAVWRS